jgi:hypothetical protein
MTKKRKRLARRETTAKNTALHHNYRHTIATYRIASLLIIAALRLKQITAGR